MCWVACLWLMIGQVQGHVQQASRYEPVGSRASQNVCRVGDLGDDVAFGEERLTSGCGGSCLLAFPSCHSPGPTPRKQPNELDLEESVMMQNVVLRPARWLTMYNGLGHGLYRVWRHPFAARHFVRSDEMKGLKNALHTGNGKFRTFVNSLGDMNRLLAQFVEAPPEQTPLQDLILYQDEHTYCLPIMIQVIVPDGIRQGTVILDKPYAPEWIDSAVLFAYWDPPCHCGLDDCVVLYPTLANFGESIVVKPGSFVRLRCGIGSESSIDETDCSTCLGDEVSSSGEASSFSEDRTDTGQDEIGGHDQPEGDVLFFFQVETFTSPKAPDGRIERNTRKCGA